MHLQPDGVAARAAAAPRWEADGGPRSLAWIGRYVEAARARATAEIAITEHVHRFTAARDWHAHPFWRGEATEDLGAHCEAIVAAQEAGLPVLLGIEMDWLPDRQEEIARLLEAHPFDIVLGSVHWLGPLGIDDPDDPAAGRVGDEEVWSRYLDELEAAACSGLFDVLAHPDLPKVFGRRLPTALHDRLEEATRVIAAERRGRRVLVGRPAQAGPRAVPRPRLAGPPARRRRAGDAGQRRPRPRGRGPRLPDGRGRAARGGVRDDHALSPARRPSRCRSDEGRPRGRRPPLRRRPTADAGHGRGRARRGAGRPLRRRRRGPRRVRRPAGRPPGSRTSARSSRRASRSGRG